MKLYDVIIIGAGAGGLTAALYAERYGLNVLVLSEDVGGTTNIAAVVENWPGTLTISGPELMKNFHKQIKSPIKLEKVISIKKNKNFLVQTNKSKYESKTVIIVTGTERRKLPAKNADKFEGKGLSYCATCDAPLFKNKIVAVLGGANSAAETALLLTKYAKKVYIIYRKDKLRADVSLVKQIQGKVDIIYNTNVKEIKGNQFMSSIILDNGKEMKMEGVFVEFGGVPLTEITKTLKLNLDKSGYIIVNSKKETNVQGLFAAGDVTNTPLRQIVTAAGDGAIAALSTYNYCKEGDKK